MRPSRSPRRRPRRAARGFARDHEAQAFARDAELAHAEALGGPHGARGLPVGGAGDDFQVQVAAQDGLRGRVARLECAAREREAGVARLEGVHGVRHEALDGGGLAVTFHDQGAVRLAARAVKLGLQGVLGGDELGRLTRMLAALLAGAALAVAGCITQTVLANPLASPNVLDINSGAGLAVLVASALMPGVAAVLPLAAFLGVFLTVLLVFAVASVADASRMTIVLVGMAATAVFGAGMNTVLIVAPDAYVGANTFLVGGLSGVRLMDVACPAACIAVGLVLALLAARPLNVMLKGDALAQGVGMNVRAVRLGMLAVAALLASAALSFAGLLVSSDSWCPMSCGSSQATTCGFSSR